MTKTLDLQIVSDREELESLGREWNACLSASAGEVLHLRHEWFLAGVDCFNADSELHVMLVRDGEGVVTAVAPLLIARRRYRWVPVRVLGFADNGQSPFNDFILRKGSERESLAVLLAGIAAFSHWDLVDLRKIRKGGPLDNAVITGDVLSGFRRGSKENIDSPYVTIDGDWERFLANRSTRFRKTLRNKLNRVRLAGDVCVRHCPIDSGDHDLLDEMFRVSGRSWKREAGTDLLGNPASQQFYRRICHAFGPEGRVMLWVLCKGAQVVAFEFHLQDNGVCYPIRADYDASFGDLSPGSVLEYHILKSLFEEGEVREYNSCGHHYSYLLNWSRTTRQHENAEVFSRALKMRFLYILEYRILPFLRKMRVNRAVRSVKRWISYAGA